jgi:hypothetical protein
LITELDIQGDYDVVSELARLRPSLAIRLHAALPWLRALVLGLAVLALAGPQWGVETTRSYAKASRSPW